MGKNWDESLDKAADRLGMDRSSDKYRDYNHSRSDRGLMFNREKYEEDVIRTAANDYDTRRGLEAAAMAGDKKARKYSERGIDSLKDVAKSYDVLARLKKDHVGGGGMGGAKNKMGLTQALVDWDRETMLESLDEKYGQKEEPPKDPADDIGEKAEVVLSNHMERAKNIVEDWEQGSQGVYADNSGALTQSTGIKETEPPSDEANPSAVPVADLTDPDTFYNTKMNAYKSKFSLTPDF